MLATWTGDATIVVSGLQADFTRESNADMALQLEYRVQDIGESAVQVGMGRDPQSSGLVDVTDSFSAQAGKGWQKRYIKLSCFEEAGLDMASVAYPLIINAGDGLTLQLQSAKIVANPGDANCEL